MLVLWAPSVLRHSLGWGSSLGTFVVVEKALREIVWLR